MKTYGNRYCWVIETKRTDKEGYYFWAFWKAFATREEARAEEHPFRYRHRSATSRIVKYTPGVWQ